MPVVRSISYQAKPTKKEIAIAVMLTYERPGLLTQSVLSFVRTAPDMHLVIYDDGSESDEKLRELDTVEKLGFKVNRGPHRGLVRTWREIFRDIAAGINTVYDENSQIVLLEDDLIFANNWHYVLMNMAMGVEKMGLKPGAMSCFRCHQNLQTRLYELNGIFAYQSMQHSFQINMVSAWVFDQVKFLDEAVDNSENGMYGIDVWFIAGLSHRLGLTSFISEQSWVKHIGTESVAGEQGYIPIQGDGYNLVPELSAIQ